MKLESWIVGKTLCFVYISWAYLLNSGAKLQRKIISCASLI